LKRILGKFKFTVAVKGSALDDFYGDRHKIRDDTCAVWNFLFDLKKVWVAIAPLLKT